MWTGVQFTGSLSPNQNQRWFTFNWPAAWHVVWYVVPTSPRSGAPQVDWDVAVERADANNCTYWLTVRNVTNQNITFEARFAVLN